VLFLPYLSPAFVPTSSMPVIIRTFSEHQPLTPIIDAIRALLANAPAGDRTRVAIACCVGILVVASTAALRIYTRKT